MGTAAESSQRQRISLDQSQLPRWGSGELNKLVGVRRPLAQRCDENLPDPSPDPSPWARRAVQADREPTGAMAASRRRASNEGVEVRLWTSCRPTNHPDALTMSGKKGNCGEAIGRKIRGDHAPSSASIRRPRSSAESRQRPATPRPPVPRAPSRPRSRLAGPITCAPPPRRSSCCGRDRGNDRAPAPSGWRQGCRRATPPCTSTGFTEPAVGKDGHRCAVIGARESRPYQSQSRRAATDCAERREIAVVPNAGSGRLYTRSSPLSSRPPRSKVAITPDRPDRKIRGKSIGCAAVPDLVLVSEGSYARARTARSTGIDRHVARDETCGGAFFSNPDSSSSRGGFLTRRQGSWIMPC